MAWHLYGAVSRFYHALRKIGRLWPEVGFCGLLRLAERKLATPNLPIDRLRHDHRPALRFEDRLFIGEGRLWERHSVAVIILTRGNQPLIDRCLSTMMLSISPKANVSFSILSNRGTVEAPPVGFPFSLRCHVDAARFNWAASNNRAAAGADGEYLLFLNDDVEALHPGWLEAMLEEALCGGVGAVGAKLLYPDGTIQHYGISVRWDGRHTYDDKYAARHDVGDHSPHSVDAVTGACLLTPREIFMGLDGFDDDFVLDQSDVDYCLRLHESGLRVIVTPKAELIHHETATRPPKTLQWETHRFASKWASKNTEGINISERSGLGPPCGGCSDERQWTGSALRNVSRVGRHN